MPPLVCIILLLCTRFLVLVCNKKLKLAFEINVIYVIASAFLYLRCSVMSARRVKRSW